MGYRNAFLRSFQQKILSYERFVIVYKLCMAEDSLTLDPVLKLVVMICKFVNITMGGEKVMRVCRKDSETITKASVDGHMILIFSQACECDVVYIRIGKSFV